MRALLLLKVSGISVIDSIVLILGKDMFQISKPEMFTPSAAWALKPYPNPNTISKQNPSKPELRKGVYKPRLTLSSRINYHNRREVALKMEVSLPKLMFGNNFSELRYKDFNAVVAKLASTLESMGVIVGTDVLAQAPLLSVHYCKNIALTDGSIPFHYINKIKEANVKAALDTNQTDYRNEGHAYKWHCNAYEVVFYDKMHDLEKAKISSKRAIEKDNELQLHLLTDLRKGKKRFEVLRTEVRINTRKKMKQLFGKLSIANNLTFKKLFKPAISKKILLHYLDEIEQARPALLDYRPRNTDALLADLLIHNPHMNAKQILQLYGLKRAMEQYDMRTLRKMLSRCSSRSWQRLMKDAQQVQLPAVHSPLRKLREDIERFKIVDIKICKK